LVLDIQGAEIEAMLGFSEYLDRINFIITEVSVSKIYRRAPKFKAVKKFLRKREFELISYNISSNFDYGDALFVRTRKNHQKFFDKLKSKSRGQLVRLILINLGLKHVAKKFVAS
jgi:hypothetical protein